MIDTLIFINLDIIEDVNNEKRSIWKKKKVILYELDKSNKARHPECVQSNVKQGSVVVFTSPANVLGPVMENIQEH